MLQAINDRMKVFGWLIIVPLALVFAVWGVHGLVDFTTGGERGVRVNGDELDAQRIRQAWQQQLADLHRVYPDEIPADVRERMQRSLVEQFVNARLLEQKVAERNFRVTDQDVVESIRQEELFRVGGEFSRDAYLTILRQQGISPEQFEAQQREQLRTRQLQAGLFLSAFATPAEVERYARLRGERRELAWAVVPVSRFLPKAQPDDAAVQAYYEANRDEFMSPESVRLEFVALRIDDVAAQVNVAEPALREYYESVRERYVEPEQRRARHILIPVGTDPAAARTRAAELQALATQPGADFAALARQHSQDAGSAQQGGDLGWAERSFFVGPFADALFEMRPGEVRGPVQTEFGFHVIRLEDVRPGQSRAFEEVRPELEQEFRRVEAERLFGERQELLDQLAFENADSLEPIAGQLGLQIREIPVFTRTAGGGELGAQPRLVQAAFAPDVLGGQNSRAIEVQPGEVVVLRASEHRVPALQPLAAVRERAAEGARRAQAEAEARAAAERIAEQLRGGQPWEGSLRTVGNFVTPVPERAPPADALRFQPARLVGRTEPAVAPEVLTAAFRAPRPANGPAVGTVPLPSGDVGVYAVTAVQPGEVGAGAPAERQDVAARRAQADLIGYISALRARAEVRVSPTLFE